MANRPLEIAGVVRRELVGRTYRKDPARKNPWFETLIDFDSQPVERGKQEWSVRLLKSFPADGSRQRVGNLERPD